ncbi:MAG: serine/threonine protein kinase [Candidatus Melainabacteria bacterium]|nr:serine/threonine protein kinase [Candidatus Melainabacteria bacterium]
MSDANNQGNRDHNNDAELDPDTKPLTLAESIRRKIAEMEHSKARELNGASIPIKTATPASSKITSLPKIPAREIQEGSVIYAYNILTLLHTGESARIFVAEHSLLNRRLAAKILTSSATRDTLKVKRLQEEARALSKLESAHLTAVHDFGIAPTGHPFMIFELVEAPSLEHLLKSKGQPPAEFSMQIIEQVGEAISEVHSQELIYANLKPGHVLVKELPNDRVNVKLIDFFAVYRDRGLPTSEPSEAGAPYMSPEQLYLKPYEKQTDVYSLACLSFELLTGKPPFLEQSLLGYIQAHSTKRPQKVDGAPVSDATYQVLFKALKKEPADRHRTVKEFVGDLKNALLGD